MTAQCDIGVIGLAVMGQNLVLNMADHGFHVAAYNRTTSRVDEFLEGEAREKSVVGCYSLEEFVHSLKKPRIAMLMVKAGKPVNQTVKQLTPLMDPGDIIIDGGNSYFLDTEDLIKELQPLGLHYMGTGISGGEEGARHGPSIMPGGSKEAWPRVKPIMQAIAARVGPDNNIPCCEWVGSGGAASCAVVGGGVTLRAVAKAPAGLATSMADAGPVSAVSSPADLWSTDGPSSRSAL